MAERSLRFLCCLLAAAVFSASVAPPVEAKSLFNSRRTFGVLFLAGSGYLAKKAIDFRLDANRIYDAYRVARTSEEADRLFDRVSDRDTKSQMSLGVSVVLLVSGLRLLLHSGADDNIPKIDRRLKLEVNGDARKQSLQVAVKKTF